MEAEFVQLGLYALKVVGTAFAIIVLSLFGWCVSSLHVLAGWSSGGLADRLQIVRGMFASVGAGTVVSLIGIYVGLPIVIIAINAFLAGMAGERYLIPTGELLLARVNAIFNALVGKNGHSNNDPPTGGTK